MLCILLLKSSKLFSDHWRTMICEKKMWERARCSIVLNFLRLYLALLSSCFGVFLFFFSLFFFQKCILDYCMMYFRKQLVSMINNRDSPYIRGIGFMFIRFCQPPTDLWPWMEPYLVSLKFFYFLRFVITFKVI